MRDKNIIGRYKLGVFLISQVYEETRLHEDYTTMLRECIDNESEIVKDEKAWLKELRGFLSDGKVFIPSSEFTNFYKENYNGDKGDPSEDIKEIMGEEVSQHVGNGSANLPIDYLDNRAQVEIERRQIVEKLLENERSYIQDLESFNEEVRGKEFPDLLNNYSDSKYSRVYSFWKESIEIVKTIEETIDQREKEINTYFRGSEIPYSNMIGHIYSDSFEADDPILDGLREIRQLSHEQKEMTEKCLIWGW